MKIIALVLLVFLLAISAFVPSYASNTTDIQMSCEAKAMDVLAASYFQTQGDTRSQAKQDVKKWIDSQLDPSALKGVATHKVDILTKVMTGNEDYAVKVIYDNLPSSDSDVPTIQPRVWYGASLILCEIGNGIPVSEVVVYPDITGLISD